MLHELCISKSGILTTGKMRVAKYVIGEQSSEAMTHHHEGLDSLMS
jgi:hypothetical protein